MPAFFNSKTPRGLCWFRRMRFALLALALFFSVSAGAATFEETLKKAEQGEAAAQEDSKYSKRIELRDNLAREMTPPQIAEAQALAREWQKQPR